MEERTERKSGENPIQEEMGLLLSALSHDMRTPLHNVIALAQMLLSSEAEEARAATIEPYLRSILTAARDLELMTGDLTADDQARREVRFTAQELAGSVVGWIDARAKAKKLAVHIDVSALGDVPMEGDWAALLRILSNLMSNAVKYTPPGGAVSLTARSLCRTDAGRIEAEFVVEDNGVGMDAAFLKRMYDPFVRSRAALEGRIPGHGLGLAIVRRLTERMKGSIDAQSEPGKGSRFCVRVPLRAVCRQKNEAEEGQMLAGKVFLLAEDNDLSAQIAQELLARKGARMRRAADGIQVVRLFQDSPENTFDAILMDMWMPQMGGCDAARQIRAMSRADAAYIPIFALTAGGGAQETERAKAAGMNDCLSKPLDTGRLSAAMRQAERE